MQFALINFFLKLSTYRSIFALFVYLNDDLSSAKNWDEVTQSRLQGKLPSRCRHQINSKATREIFPFSRRIDSHNLKILDRLQICSNCKSFVIDFIDLTHRLLATKSTSSFLEKASQQLLFCLRLIFVVYHLTKRLSTTNWNQRLSVWKIRQKHSLNPGL